MNPSLKGRLPFRLATTSFIYPATWSENVRRLAPLVDEVELLFFESAPGSLPTAGDIRELARLGRSLSVGFNVHLPVDVCLGDADAARRREAADRMAALAALCVPLSPSSYALHLCADARTVDGGGWTSWRRRCRRGIETVLACGIRSRLLAVETLPAPPFERVLPLVEACDLSICLDVGHLLLRGQDPLDFFQRHEDRIAVVHLHGVANGRDHRGLDCMPPSQLERILQRLCRSGVTVSLEVFSGAHLQPSLWILDHWLKRISP